MSGSNKSALSVLKSPGPCLPADPGLDTACFTVESNVEPENRDRTENPPPSHVIPEVSEPPQLPMNGMMAALHKCSSSAIMVLESTVRHGYIKATSLSNGNP